ncbi:MAG: hypothetical protein RLZZ624_1239 [Cyanobacteriota bacterium]|jgi:exodeoxyribonuclease VII small subunit
MAPARRTDNSEPQSSAPGAKATRSRGAKSIQVTDGGDPGRDQGIEDTRTQRDVGPIPDDLSYQQAKTALDLLIAQLQASDLQVEEMLALYRRAQAYADHCEAVLQRVDQDVIEWDLLQDTQEMAP